MLNYTSWCNLLLVLVMGHFVGDFAFQSDRMATEKCPGHGKVLDWSWWLTAHAAIQGFLVAMIAGLPLLGLAEWLLHSYIDINKCRGYFRLAIDQSFNL